MPDETITKDAVTASVPALELRRALTAVLPHAGTDDTLPALTCVRFEVAAGWLYLVTTDRYSIGVARIGLPLGENTRDAAALLPAGSARAMRKLLKKPDGDEPHEVAAIAFRPDGTLGLGVSKRVSVTWETQEGNSPDWRTLLHGHLTAEPVTLGDGYGLNPGKLARFTEVPDRWDECLSVRFIGVASHPQGSSGSRMALFTRGDWFLGALMPVRRADGAPPEAWRAWAAITAPAEAAGPAVQS